MRGSNTAGDMKPGACEIQMRSSRHRTPLLGLAKYRKRKSMRWGKAGIARVREPRVGSVNQNRYPATAVFGGKNRTLAVDFACQLHAASLLLLWAYLRTMRCFGLSGEQVREKKWQAAGLRVGRTSDTHEQRQDSLLDTCAKDKSVKRANCVFVKDTPRILDLRFS